MSLFDRIPFLPKGGEVKTIELLKREASLVLECTRQLECAFTQLSGGNKDGLAECIKKINEAEHESDTVRRGIEAELYSGAFLPISRSRILDLAEAVNDIGDQAQDAAKIMEYIDGGKLGKELGGVLSQTMGKTVDCVSELESAIINIEDEALVAKHVDGVEKLEHEIDLLGHDAYKIIYAKSDAKSTIVLTKLVEYVEAVSNRAEDASDVLSLIILIHKP